MLLAYALLESGVKRAAMEGPEASPKKPAAGREPNGALSAHGTLPTASITSSHLPLALLCG
jgi:hypothetical protein